ncbi:hypothetical protein [Oceanobacillus senegalensis]|uniref:hypothetical protein n=1 Tax=Oceanobacillus senegalensis TaxID=1936063 RepID=UPI000A310A73|nr:hypothetical protein [Oceanobacillus senegalensis]
MGKVKFILLIGLTISLALVMNYYVIKFFIAFLFDTLSWEYTIMEFLLVVLTSVLLGLLFGVFVHSRRMVN